MNSLAADNQARCFCFGLRNVAAMNGASARQRGVDADPQISWIARVITKLKCWRDKNRGNKVPFPACEAKHHPSCYPIHFTTREGALKLRLLLPQNFWQGTRLAQNTPPDRVKCIRQEKTYMSLNSTGLLDTPSSKIYPVSSSTVGKMWFVKAAEFCQKHALEPTINS